MEKPKNKNILSTKIKNSTITCFWCESISVMKVVSIKKGIALYLCNKHKLLGEYVCKMAKVLK